MKKLYFIILLFCLGFSQTGNSQGLLDNIQYSPNYICQVDSFSISMWVWSSSSYAQIDSIQQAFRNDTLHLKGYITNGPLGATMKVFTTIKVPTPPSGNYTLYFQRYESFMTGPPRLYGSHTDSFSVCMGAPLSVPENNANNQLTTKIYPNPTSDFLTIHLPETKAQTVIATLTDVTGRQVLSQLIHASTTTVQINVEKLPAGIYTLQLQADNSYKRLKVVKQ